MRQDHCKDIYELYDVFIDTFLFKGNSILSNHQGILNQESTSNCIDRYINNYDDGVEKFDNKIQIHLQMVLKR